MNIPNNVEFEIDNLSSSTLTHYENNSRPLFDKILQKLSPRRIKYILGVTDRIDP